MKKVIVICLAIIMMFAVCSCTSVSREEIKEAKEEVAESIEEAEEEAEEEVEEEEPERDEEGYKILADGIKEKGGWFYITEGDYTFGDILENKQYYYFEVVEGEGWLWFDSWENHVDVYDEVDDMLFLTKGQYITLSPEENDVMHIFPFHHDEGFTVKCF